MVRNVVRVAVLTLALGATVVVSWAVVRGPSVLNGPGPFLDPSWYLVWAVQAALVVLVGVTAGRRWGGDTSTGAVVGLVVAAWVGELLVATIVGPLVSSDLDPIHGPLVWLVATGGLIQPVAATAGALAGRASIRRPKPEAAV